MPYDFASLSPADFEDLVRDVVGRKLGESFEAFAAAAKYTYRACSGSDHAKFPAIR